LRADIIRAPDDPGAILKDHGYSYEGKNLHGFWGVEDAIHDGTLKEIAQDEKACGTDEKGKEWVDPGPEENRIGNVHPPDHHFAMGEVDHPEHAKNKGEA
jgi:hypothetical protein